LRDGQQFCHVGRDAEGVDGEDGRVRGVMARSTFSGSRFKVRASISTNTGVARACRTALAAAMKVNDGRITSSPSPIPSASSPRCSPAVPELSATACGTPT
jgi:hypothetical protein